MDATRVGNGTPQARSGLGWVFIGPFGLRSGWRFLLFLLLAAGLIVGLTFGVKHFDSYIPRWFRPLSQEAAGCLAVFGATWILSRVDRKPIWVFGLGPLNRSRNLLVGIVTGFVSLSLLMGLLVATGAFRLGAASLHGSAALAWGGFWLVVFVLVGFTEELMTRGYLLFALSQGIGFWPAAVLMSVFFGAGHLGNKGEDYIGISAAVFIGVVLAFSLWWTGSLWWAIGYHLAWDWAETFFYGVPDSGMPSAQHLWSGTATGPNWLSGGSVGPEGSILVIPVILLLAAVVRFTLPRAPVAGLERLRTPERPPQGH